MPQVRPHQVYDFTAFSRRAPTQQQPGDRLDAQFAEHARAIGEIQRMLAEVDRKLGERWLSPQPREPTLPGGMLGPNAGGPYAGDDKGATATSADYAQVSIDWAEHMPDTIPNQTMAVMAITGQHWSSRWWANQAALSANQVVGNYLPLAGGQMTGPLVVPVVANLSVGGGATGQVLTTVGSGILGWSTPSGVFIDAPSNSQYYSRYNGGWVVSPGGLTDAPNDGALYGRKSQAWSAVPVASTVAPVMDGTAAAGVGTTWARADHVHPSDASRLALSGGALTGALTLSGPPTAPLHAATKAYVDAGAFMPINGVVDGSNAAPGQIGEYISSGVVQGSAVALTTVVEANVTSISLSAGDWNVSGSIDFYPAATTTAANLQGGINSVSATPPTRGTSAATFNVSGSFPSVAVYSFTISPARFSLTATTTVYLVALASFAVSTMKAGGFIQARRIR